MDTGSVGDMSHAYLASTTTPTLCVGVVYFEFIATNK